MSRGTQSRSSPYRPAGHSISRHYLTRLKRQSSRLLICGFGVQVPGGAPDPPGLAWGFIAPGHFLCVRFVPMVAPWLLARTDPAIRVLSKTAYPAPDAGTITPDRRRHVRPTPPQAHQTNGLDLPRGHRQRAWSPLYQCRHAQCNLLVNGARTADTPVALTLRPAGCPPGMRGTAAMCFRVAVPAAADTRSG